jgi:small nuclear ribonucleoprotein (snRNP)-like protein
LRTAAKTSRPLPPQPDRLEAFLQQEVVVDLRTEYVCLGTLRGYDEHFLELKNADIHDLRDTDTTREVYVAESKATGIKRNRRRVLLWRSEVVTLARLDDVVDE